MSIYKKTATVANNGKIYVFGRRDELDGHPVSEGGYELFVKKSTYCGQKHGGLDHHWACVKQNMTFEEAVALMNIKCGYKAFGN